MKKTPSELGFEPRTSGRQGVGVTTQLRRPVQFVRPLVTRCKVVSCQRQLQRKEMVYSQLGLEPATPALPDTLFATELAQQLKFMAVYLHP